MHVVDDGAEAAIHVGPEVVVIIGRALQPLIVGGKSLAGAERGKVGFPIALAGEDGNDDGIMVLLAFEGALDEVVRRVVRGDIGADDDEDDLGFVEFVEGDLLDVLAWFDHTLVPKADVCAGEGFVLEAFGEGIIFVGADNEDGDRGSKGEAEGVVVLAVVEAWDPDVVMEGEPRDDCAADEECEGGRSVDEYCQAFGIGEEDWESAEEVDEFGGGFWGIFVGEQGDGIGGGGSAVGAEGDFSGDGFAFMLEELLGRGWGAWEACGDGNGDASGIVAALEAIAGCEEGGFGCGMGGFGCGEVEAVPMGGVFAAIEEGEFEDACGEEGAELGEEGESGATGDEEAWGLACGAGGAADFVGDSEDGGGGEVPIGGGSCG